LTTDNRKTDLTGGIWHISQLDHLVEVKGAGAAIASLQADFHSRVEANWKQACEAFAQSCRLSITSSDQSEATFYDVEADDEDDSPLKTPVSSTPVAIRTDDQTGLRSSAHPSLTSSSSTPFINLLFTTPADLIDLAQGEICHA
jgi:hypothetical protein